MKRWKIKSKLLSSFLIVALITAVVGGTGIFGLNRLKESESELHAVGMNTIMVNQMTTNLQQQRVAYRDAVLHMEDDPLIVQESILLLEELEAEFEEIVSQLSDRIVMDKSYDYLGQVYTIYNTRFIPIKNQLIDAVKVNDKTEVLNDLVPLREATDEMMLIVEQFVDFAQASTENTQYNDRILANWLVVILSALAVLSVAVAAIFGIRISRKIANPINRIIAVADSLSVGDVSVDLEDDTSCAEVGRLTASFQKIADGVQEQAHILETIAGGDFTIQAPVRSDRDVTNQAINDLIDRVSGMLVEIRRTSQLVASASAQVSQGAQDLATGSAEQASRMQQFSAAVEQVSNGTNTNADHAGQALDVTANARSLVQESVEQMQQVQEAIGRIDDSSQNMARIIQAIEDIATQTHLLALNAAVEAARAGVHGRGFAIVADEVRNLASKSSQAARETAELIQHSVNDSTQGHALVRSSNESLRRAARLSEQSLELIRQIAAASIEQNTSINEINQGIADISKTVQANSSTSQESAAAAQVMSGQAAVLQNIVLQFHLNHDPDPEHPIVPPKIHRLPTGSDKYA